MEIANRIRIIHETYGIRQVEVAYKLDITPQAYGKIERSADKAKIETLIKISIAIGVSIFFLIDSNNPNYYEQKNNL